MNMRRAIVSTAIVGGTLLMASAPAFAQSVTTSPDTLPNSGSNGSGQNVLIVAGGLAMVAGASLVVVRRRSARA